jgi:hypothetical protein
VASIYRQTVIVLSRDVIQLAPISVDGYHFAISQDPEDNPIGLITPFNN